MYAVSPRLNTVASDAIDNNTGLIKIKAAQNNSNVTGYAGLLKNCAIKFTMRPQTSSITFSGNLVSGTFNPCSCCVSAEYEVLYAIYVCCCDVCREVLVSGVVY